MKIFTDGSAHPNPGPGGFGVVVVDDDDNLIAICKVEEGYLTTIQPTLQDAEAIRTGKTPAIDAANPLMAAFCSRLDLTSIRIMGCFHTHLEENIHCMSYPIRSFFNNLRELYPFVEYRLRGSLMASCTSG